MAITGKKVLIVDYDARAAEAIARLFQANGLDVLVARAVLDNIRRLRDLGKCVVFSTHIMREVEKLCDRVAIISRGHIRASGTLEELRRQYGQEDLEELFFALVS